MPESTQPPPSSPSPRTAHPLELLLELIRRARAAESLAALRFIAVNDSHLLAPFQQSALWLHDDGVVALSGLIEVEANAPYVQWLQRVCAHLAATPARALQAGDLPPELAGEWGQWLPAHALWIPFGAPGGAREGRGGFLAARTLPWRELDVRLFVEWMATWGCIQRSFTRRSIVVVVRRSIRRVPGVVRRRAWWWAVAVIALLLIPVRLSVLAPGELVPAQPIVIRAPLEGIIREFHVQTNEDVKAGQPLFSYDEAVLASRAEVAAEAWRTAQAEERQLSQQAMQDGRARAALAAARGNVEEKRLEVEYLRSQLERARVVAPRDGVAFVDDPVEWIGRPVTAGQRIMRLAEPEDKEIEAWLPVGDAIVLAEGAPARLYLDASPLSPTSGYVRFVAYEAVRRPDGQYAYRVRAALEGSTAHRVGLKGTVRLSGRRVPLIYWMLRRPLAALREFAGR